MIVLLEITLSIIFIAFSYTFLLDNEILLSIMNFTLFSLIIGNIIERFQNYYYDVTSFGISTNNSNIYEYDYSKTISHIEYQPKKVDLIKSVEDIIQTKFCEGNTKIELLEITKEGNKENNSYFKFDFPHTKKTSTETTQPIVSETTIKETNTIDDSLIGDSLYSLTVTNTSNLSSDMLSAYQGIIMALSKKYGKYKVQSILDCIKHINVTNTEISLYLYNDSPRSFKEFLGFIGMPFEEISTELKNSFSNQNINVKYYEYRSQSILNYYYDKYNV